MENIPVFYPLILARSLYLYHTLRYKQPWRDRFRDQFPTVEDLGVQVLVMQRPFRLDMPLVQRDKLAAGAATSMSRDESPVVALSQVTSAAITAECTYNASAAKGIRLRVRSSPDGIEYDTVDLHMFEPKFEAGRSVRQTFTFTPSTKFIKVLVENLDASHDVADVKVTVTLGG